MRKGHYELFKRLLAKGARLKQKAPYDTAYGNTLNNRILASAIYGGNEDIIQYCLSHGCKLDKKTANFILLGSIGEKY